MAAIRTLLNPMPEAGKTPEPEPELNSRNKIFARNYSASPQARKKQKICKDAAVFTRGPVRGECRYPPHEIQDEMLSAQHQQFEIYPMGEIAEYPRHIPYNSEKKAFLDKTGRECLEVFQYRFKVPGEETMFSMLWDYNIGLVRTTPLFKCTGHSKTTPAKMLNRNPGLREICHSITGGALVAQGYWMPYEAAKAVAATFCWNIRYALTPVFGVDFPDLCVPPDSERYGDMVIDPAITKHCTEQARQYRSLERTNSRASTATPGPLTPDTPTYPRHIKQFRPKASDIVSSAYSSDISNEENYSIASPEPGYRNIWTPANTPRSVPRSPPRRKLLLDTRPPKFVPLSRLSSPALSPKTRKIEVDEPYDGDSSEEGEGEPRIESVRDTNDEKAAYLLMSLRMQGTSLGSQKRKRRAST